MRSWTIFRRAALAVLFALPIATGTGAAEAEKVHLVRFHLEAGLSRQTDPPVDMAPQGYCLDAGFAIGYRVAFLVDAGYEGYPGTPESRIVYAQVRRSGGGDWHVLTQNFGLRVSIPTGRLDSFLEATLGAGWFRGRTGTYVDEATGTITGPDFPHRWEGATVSWALGARTRREQGPDYYLGFRHRYSSTLFEGSDEATALQVRIGVLTR